MSKTLSLGSRARASMALLAAAMEAAAPVATVSPAPASTQAIQTPGNQQAQPSMAQQQTVRASSNQTFLDGGFHGWGFGATTSIHTFPRWNQRKARKASRQTGRKVQKRYKR